MPSARVRDNQYSMEYTEADNSFIHSFIMRQTLRQTLRRTMVVFTFCAPVFAMQSLQHIDHGPLTILHPWLPCSTFPLPCVLPYHPKTHLLLHHKTCSMLCAILPLARPKSGETKVRRGSCA